MTDEELKLLVQSNALAIQAIGQRVDSNARAIQAMVEQRATDRVEHQERIRFLEETQRELVQTQQGIANLVTALDVDRPTVLRKLTTIENKIDRILDNQ